MRDWNWGTILGWVGVAQCVLASCGYAVARDPRRALYYIFAAGLTTTIVWPGRS